MTGNVVFLGLALAGAPGFSLAPSLAALVGFLAGALAGGRLVQRWAGHRRLLLRNITALDLVLVALATAIAGITTVSPADPTAVAAVGVAALLVVAMGLQNTLARRLAVPDLTTTVLTMTLTGIAADARRSPAATTARRALAVLTMFAGAVRGRAAALHTTLAPRRLAQPRRLPQPIPRIGAGQNANRDTGAVLASWQGDCGNAATISAAVLQRQR